MIQPTCQSSGDSEPRVIRREFYKFEKQKQKSFACIVCAIIIAAFPVSAWAGASENAARTTISEMLTSLEKGAEQKIIEARVLPPEPVTVAAEKNAKNSKKSKQREAQIQSIVSLFAKYNKELNGEKGRKYAEYIIQAGEKFDQDPFVIAAIIVHESSARNDAVSRGGDYGLMQVRWKVHQAAIKKKYPSVTQAKDIFDPKINVLIGTEIFADYRKKDDVRSGLLRYSAGNTKLVNKVVASMKILQDSYQKNLRTLS